MNITTIGAALMLVIILVENGAALYREMVDWTF